MALYARTLLVGLAWACIAGGVSAAPAATRVPFRSVDNRIVIRVAVDGKPFSFVVDTGSATTVVTPQVVAALGLHATAAGTTSGVGNATQAMQTTTLPSLRVGDLAFANEPSVVVDLSVIREHIGFPHFDGVIGYSLLKTFAVDVDSDRSVLTLSRDPLPARPGARIVSFSGTLPHVGATLDGTPATIIIDTGDRSSLTLFKGFARAHGYYAAPGALRDVLTGYGIGGPVYGDVFRLRTLGVFGTRLHGVVTRASRQRGGAFASMSEAGSIGGGVLRRFNITYDYPRHVLSVSPSAARDAADPYDRSGMWLARSGGNIVVTAVTTGGPAAAAGLRAGDLLAEIDGRRAAGADVIRVRTELAARAASTHVTIVYQRDGTTHDATLILSDLIPPP
jgi:Aspartyl protease/PDZ domain